MKNSKKLIFKILDLITLGANAKRWAVKDYFARQLPEYKAATTQFIRELMIDRYRSKNNV